MDDVKARDYKLDITWLKDDSLVNDDTRAELLELAIDAVHNLEAVILIQMKSLNCPKPEAGNSLCCPTVTIKTTCHEYTNCNALR